MKLKVGDKLYCIKSYLDNRIQFDVDNWYTILEVKRHKITNSIELTTDGKYTRMCYQKNIKLTQTFWDKNYPHSIFISEYFLTLTEVRKLKLDEIKN